MSATLVLLFACSTDPVGPNNDGRSIRTVAIQDGRPSIDSASEHVKWLQLRPDGLYDDQGRLRFDRKTVARLKIDKAFEIHRQMKLHMIKRFGEELRKRAFRYQPQPALIAQRLTPGQTSLSLAPPTAPRFAVAWDDPCMFDATVMCENEYGGEIESMFGSGSAGGDGSAPNCADILTKEANAYAAYYTTQQQYWQVSTAGVGAYGSGIVEATLMALYDQMQSYMADAKNWFNIAVSLGCIKPVIVTQPGADPPADF